MSEYKYDKDGKMTHFKYTRKGSDAPGEFEPVDQPTGGDYLGERLKYGMEYSDVDNARKQAQKRRGD